MNIHSLFRFALAGAALLFSQVSIAQFKISKVNQPDGAKTLLKSGSTLDIHINDDGTVKENFLVELDIAAFRAAHNYDVVAVIFHKNDYDNYRLDHEFESQLNAKKYGNKGIIPFYVFNTKNFKETDVRVLTENYFKCEGDQVCKIAVYGQYVTGTEGYFDRNERYQTRNLLSSRELLGYIDIKPVYSAKKLEEYNVTVGDKVYSDLQYRMRRVEDLYKREVLGYIEDSRVPVVDTPVYFALSSAFNDVFKAKLKEAKDYDQRESLETFRKKVVELDELVQMMYEKAKANKSNYKALNKQVKALTTTQQRLEFIQAM